MPLRDKGSAFPPLRKKKRSVPAGRAWEFLSSGRASFGVLGTHGLTGEGPFPYSAPMNFAADAGAGVLYLHTTVDPDSRSNRALEENPHVCFTVVAPESAIIPSGDGAPCGYSTRIRQ